MASNPPELELQIVSLLTMAVKTELGSRTADALNYRVICAVLRASFVLLQLDRVVLEYELCSIAGHA